MAKDRIEYLIKFVSEKSFAEDFQKGKLFMRPVCAFIKMYYDEYFSKHKVFDDLTFQNFAQNYAGCIGDVREGLLDDDSFTRANTGVPVFCMTYVASSQVESDPVHSIVLNKKLIEEFLKSGYEFAVVVRFEDFINNLNKYIDSGDKDLFGGYGPMIYKRRNNRETRKDCFMNCRSGKNLLYKEPAFAYQQEFRIFLNRQVNRYSSFTMKDSYKIFEYALDDKDLKNGKEVDKPYYVEQIDEIKEYSKIFRTSDFKLCGGKFKLKLGEEFK